MRGKTWTVVGPDGVAIGQSWENEGDAADVADLMNQAFLTGRGERDWQSARTAAFLSPGAARGLHKMQIRETITRECCEPDDLQPVADSPLVRGGNPELMFCRHCGRQYRLVDFTDAAGSTDWEYRPIKTTSKDNQ